MPGPDANRLSRAHQAELAAVAALVEQQVRRVAAGADRGDIDGWWRRVARELLELVAAAFAGSRTLGARYLRRHATLEGAQVEPALARWDTARAATALRVTGPVEWKRHLAATGDEAGARQVMATTLAGSAQRLALAGDRDTVAATVRDSDVVVGWRRQVDADPCAFCAMLASRGAVYKTAATAGDPQFGGTQYHDHDQCIVVPLYEREEEPPEVDELFHLWRQVTTGHSGKAAIREWRRWWDENRGEVDLGQRAEPPPTTPEPEREPASASPASAASARRREIVDITGRSRESVLTEFDRQARLTPQAEQRLAGVHDTGDFETRRNSFAYYNVHGGDAGDLYHLHLHPGWSSTSLANDAGTRAAVSSGWFTPTGAQEPVQTVFAHEYGHHVTRAMFSNSGIIDPAGAERLLETIRDQLGIPLDTSHSDRAPISTVGTLMPRLTAAVENHPRVADRVSSYAMSNGWELLAEVWQEYSTMGDQARPHIRAIGDVMRELAEEAS